MKARFQEFWLLFGPGGRRRIILAFLGSILAALLEIVALIAIVPLMQLVTGAEVSTGSLGSLSGWLGEDDPDRLATILALAIVVVYMAKGIFALAYRWWLYGFLFEEEAQTATRLLESYLRAPYWLHLQRNSAELLRNLVDATSRAYTNVAMGAMSGVAELASIVAILGALIILAPVPALILSVYFAVLGLLYGRFVRGRAKTAGEELNLAAFRSLRVAQQAFGSVKEMLVRNRQEHFIEEYRVVRLRAASARRNATFLNDAPRYLVEIGFIVGVAGMTVLLFRSSQQSDGLALLVLFAAAGFRLLPNTVRLLASINNIRIGMPGFELVVADLVKYDQQQEAASRGDGARPPEADPAALQDRIDVENVSFSYRDSDTLVLNKVSCSIPAGTSLAIVGSSGAGKTTLADLLLGLHEPTSGRILVDGVPIGHDLASWQRSIGFVPQDIYLLDDTVRANIAFGLRSDEVDEKAVEDAVVQAQLRDLMDELPLGLDTVIGERGVRLSGGQRQRIGIARALYLRPTLLVLDEATSALDGETERQITSTLELLQGRHTMLVIAHRLSTIRHCDQVLFLEAGEVAGHGTFEEVAASSEEFEHLVRLANLDDSRTASGMANGSPR